MPFETFRLAVVVQTMADDICLAEALLFPGVSCLSRRPEAVRARLARLIGEQIRGLAPGDLHRARIRATPAVASIEIEVPPVERDVQRRSAVTLTLHYLWWQHGDEGVVAYLPSLGIEVLAENEARLREFLAPQIRSALSRRRSAESLRDLVLLARPQQLEVRRLPLKVKLPTLKERAVKDEQREERKKSLLKTIASDLTQPPHRPFYERAAEIARAAELLTAATPRSILLVGRSGVGKTALVGELARRRADFGLAETPFWSTSGSRIVAGMTGFGMWQKRCQDLVREASKGEVVLHLGNLIELLEVGKGAGNTQGVASLLRPDIQRGAFRAIVECTAEQLAIAERDEPQLLEAFEQMEIGEPDDATLGSILTRAADEFQRGGGPPSFSSKRKKQRKALGKKTPDPFRADPLSPATLATLQRLHRRYATYSASPGRPLRFLQNLLEDRAPGEPLGPSEITAAFSRETGLPGFMLDERVPLDLAATRSWFRVRVMGQPEAVESALSLLAAIKAGLVRGGKPLASLLFIGPTGVGKTETAKALAEFLYQDPGRMIRFDMSEYAHPAAVERLIGGAYESQGLLTQKVRDQPFMVVLLDEFEKAHPRLFDVLLQVLGEGRLTDGAGRTADFSNSVVIMTSNLGVETFRAAGLGFGGRDTAAAGAERHFERELAAFLRPEMFNRIDRIVPFAPLDQTTVADIARRELARVTLREGIRLRAVEFDVEPAVVAHLAAEGYDPRYGARPLKRAIERDLVAPAAEQITRYGGDVAIRCRASMAGGVLTVTAEARPNPGVLQYTGQPASQAAAATVDLRRRVQQLERCGQVLRLRNEIERLKQMEAKRQKEEAKELKKLGPNPSPEALTRLKKRQTFFTAEQAKTLAQQELIDRVDELGARVRLAETQTLEGLYAGQNVADVTLSLKRRFDDLLFELYLAPRDRTGRLALVIIGKDFDRACDLALAYHDLAGDHEASRCLYWLAPYEPAYDPDAPPGTRRRSPPHGLAPDFRLGRHNAAEAGVTTATPPLEKLLDAYVATRGSIFQPPLKCFGVAACLTGVRPAVLLEGEAGRHEFISSQGDRADCEVEVIRGSLVNYEPPADIGRCTGPPDPAVRRTYDWQKEVCREAGLDELTLRRDGLKETIAEAARRGFEKRMEAILE